MEIRKILLAVLAVGILVLAALLFLGGSEPVSEEVVEDIQEEVTEEIAAPVTQSVIGTSVEGRSIEAYTFGTGETDMLFVGGIHGGYEWNSVLLAYQFIEAYKAVPALVPEHVTVHIIPSLNPDGVAMVTGKDGRFTEADILSSVDQATARFNANGVDLNRNFDCKWQSESSWRGKSVSAGAAPFSEPEAVALRDYVASIAPEAVVFWHSQANNVYASECENGVLPKTLEVMQVYADAAGYGAVPSFDAYPVTGDAEGWLASIGIPAITVEMKTHETIEFAQNNEGVEALYALFAPEEEHLEVQ